jgi:2-polyprenyl-3-methyl-5-hydroxy-6-metoxy-1,4-benzoquinol methylase
MPERSSCNLCGSSEQKLLYRLADYRLRIDDRVWSVVKCKECGLGYLSPRPTTTEIDAYYPAAYFNGRGGNNVRARYERQAAYVPATGTTLLDVGTGRGDFLLTMRARGWKVAGIEPSPAAGNPHGLEIHGLRFPEEAGVLSGPYDVITAWAVFEHLHDPLAAFRECCRLLRPGGHLIVQCPNLASVFGRFSRQEDVPRHLHFFSPKTLNLYGARTGLQLTRTIHTTSLFGGSGRGVLRLVLVRSLGRSTEDFFTILRSPRRERFSRWPVLSVPWTVVAAVEHVLLADRFVRAARLSGQIVATFKKPLESQ